MSSVPRALALVLLVGCASRPVSGPLDREEARRASLELRSVIEMAVDGRIRPVEFEFDSAELLATSNDLLDKVAEILRRYPTLKLIVAGHTDDVGSEDYNERLSLARAKSVKTYLSQQGVYPDFIKVFGYGKSRPTAQGDSERARSLNRRVEFVLTTREWETVY